MDEWAAKGEIEPASVGCKWNAPLLPVPKVSGGVVVPDDMRVPIDFRAHNNQTVPPDFYIPILCEMLRKMEGANYFAEIDLAHAFHQIKLFVESRDITTFTDPNGKRWRWTVMVEGAKNAANHMQWVLERVLENSLDYAAAYIDNILIPGSTLEECITRAKEVIDRLTNASLRINFKKSRFGLRRIRFMGSLIDGRSRSIDPIKVSALQKMSRPRTGPQMESFLGFVNYLRDFIPFYAMVVGPLERFRKCKKISDQE